MKILICGNGNVTRRNGKVFIHGEIARFIEECAGQWSEVGYATISLEASKENVKNLADTAFPAAVRLWSFESLSGKSFIVKLLLMFSTLFKCLYLIFRYDFLYCYCPGSLGDVLLRLCMIFRRPYGLYVRGELEETGWIRKVLSKAEFIFATGLAIVTKIVPKHPRCTEIVPMCRCFREDIPVRKRDGFHSPLRGLFVGRVEEAKGVRDLLQGLALLKRKGREVSFRFIGNYQDSMPGLVEEFDLGDRVVLAGPIDSWEELGREYEEADFLCLPSYTEGFPRVLYEAMAHSLPSVTTFVGSIPTRMHAGENCLEIRPHDGNDIAAAIEKLLQSPELFRRLSDGARDSFEIWNRRFGKSSHALQLRAELQRSHDAGRR